MNNRTLLNNSFYWDDMEGQLFNGLYNPKQNWHGWYLPYFTLGSMMRLKELLEKEHRRKGSGLLLAYGQHLNMVFYDTNGYVSMSEPITIDDKLYWAVHEKFEWCVEILHDARTRN